MGIIATKASDKGYVEAVDGIERKTLAYGEKTLTVEFRMQKGKELPMHSHPHEQAGYLVSGHIILTINGEKYDMMPGDAWVIKGELMHGAQIVEDSVAVEVFAPVREDYIPQ